MESRTDDKHLMEKKIRRLENEKIKSHAKQFQTEIEVENLKNDLYK